MNLVKVPGYKTNKQKSAAFLHIKEIPKRETKKTISLTISSKRMK